MKDFFHALADAVCRLPQAASAGTAVERVTLYLASEQSDFVRFNRSALRQMTTVEQHKTTVAVVAGQRRAAASTTLSGDAKADLARLLAMRDALARDLPMVPPDPHLQMPQSIVDTLRDDCDDCTPSHDGRGHQPSARSPAGGLGQAGRGIAGGDGSHRRDAGGLPPVEEVVAQVLEQSRGLDLVGFHASGPVIAAFADSRGQRNWHRIRNFHLDWSLYCGTDAAVRDRRSSRCMPAPAGMPPSSAAGWRSREPGSRCSSAPRARSHPAPIAPGSSRWPWRRSWALLPGAVSASSSGAPALPRWASWFSGAVALSQQFDLCEATAEGIAPAFTSTGHVRPPSVPLVSAGRCAQTLVSPRSAAEFGLPANADDDEYPASLALAGGTLAAADALAALDSGLWIGNLWYLGYSDRQACRMTGMTRFACFLVERGEISRAHRRHALRRLVSAPVRRRPGRPVARSPAAARQRHLRRAPPRLDRRAWRAACGHALHALGGAASQFRQDLGGVLAVLGAG